MGERKVEMEELKYVDRKNTNCNKWDNLETKFGKSDLLAMWVADMDFKIPECVREALLKYVEMGAVGYYKVPDSYYEAFINWEEKHYGLKVEKEWIRFSPGVVTAFNWIIQIMTKPEDAIIVTTPVYYPFLNAVDNNQRKLVTSDLINTNGEYTIDFEDFEQKIIDNNVKLFIMSSPHNPVGRVWKKWELEKLLDICRKHQVFVIADEIHQDLTYNGHQNIPAYTVGDHKDMMIAITAPSKTFNLAGAQNSVIMIADENLRNKWDSYIAGMHMENGNAFGYIAAEAAYTGGEEWWLAVKDRIYKNYTYLKETLETNLPNAVVSSLEGTYLVWIDLRKCAEPSKIKEIVLEKCKLAVDFGDWFGGEKFDGFIRINLATSLENVKLAAEALIENFK